MYLQVQDTAEKYKKICMAMPAFVRGMNRVNVAVKVINEEKGHLQTNSKSVTTVKDEKRQEMAKRTGVIMAALRAYASENKLSDLIMELEMNERDILQCKETDADDYCQHVHELALVHKEGLSDQGVTVEELDAHQQSIDQFSDLIGKPRTVTTNRVVTRSKVDLAFDEADDVLHNILDNLALRLEAKDADFYGAWQSARMVIATGGGGSKDKAEEGKSADVSH
jgi:hypothetical protein